MAKLSSGFSRLRKRVARLLAPQVPHDSTRVSSFPFVSGDTFRLMAGTEFAEDGVRRFQGQPGQRAFVKADLVASLFGGSIETIDHWATLNSTSASPSLSHSYGSWVWNKHRDRVALAKKIDS